MPLVHPELRVGQAGSVFKSLRMNVFESIEGSFDLVICMHLLVPRYFTPEQIASGITNLSNALAPGGTLIVGATEHFRIVQRGADGMLRSRERRSTGDVV